MTVGQRIKQRRMELGMTQSELAEKMGYQGKTAVSAAENKGDNITTTKVKKFADALGVTPRWLMGYEDNEPDYIWEDKGKAYHIEFDRKDVSNQTMKYAMQFYELYASSGPEVQSAVDLLLKSAKEEQKRRHQNKSKTHKSLQ